MLTNRLLPSLALGAILLAAGVALPAAAHDNDHHDRWESYRHDDDHHWRHEHHHWHERYYYEPQYERRFQERYYVEPRVYYSPAYAYPEPNDGVTITYRDRW